MIRLILVILTITAGVVLLSYSYPPPDGKYVVLFEVAKAFLQLSVVIVLGGLVKYYYDQLSEQKTRITELNDFRKSMIEELVIVRTDVERQKRLFLMSGPKEKINGYQQAIYQLLELRIKISRIWHNFETSRTSFSEPEKISDFLNAMRGFLVAITQEYNPEQVSQLLHEGKDPDINRLLRDCDTFQDFIGMKEGELYNNFLSSYQDALTLMRRDILSGKLPEQPKDIS